MHLRTAYALSTYAPLDLAATAKSSGTGTIQGYGLRANATQSDGLYQATVSLTGASTDAYSGRAQHLTGVTGASNHGDSGGPLIVNGKVVAVCSTGDSADPGANTKAGSNYALLSQASSWIRHDGRRLNHLTDWRRGASWHRASVVPPLQVVLAWPASVTHQLSARAGAATTVGP